MAFFFQAVCPRVSAADFAALLPAPGAMTGLSASFAPASLKGVRLLEGHGGLRLEFVLDKGDDASAGADSKENVRRLVSYFLTALTLPGEEMWVNLSPYEGDRIVPAKFGMTEMGRDLLAQDYLLKQLSASLFYPEKGLGKEFWDKVYKEARERFGVSDVPVDTFNKVWIVPGKATVYENGMTGFILKRHLKVMLASDYEAMSHQKDMAEPSAPASPASDGLKDNVKNIIREIILPAIEKEVNEGRQFAPLRQVYDAQILAVWFKTALKSSLLGESYADRQKIAGVDVNDPAVNEGIYRRYVEAFRQGVFNYVKEEQDPETHELLPRKYFSGGAKAWDAAASEITHDLSMDVVPPDRAEVVVVDLDRSQTSLERSREVFRLSKEQLIFFEYTLSALGHGGPLDIGGYIGNLGSFFSGLRFDKKSIPVWAYEVDDFERKTNYIRAEIIRNEELARTGVSVDLNEQQNDITAWLELAKRLLEKSIVFYTKKQKAQRNKETAIISYDEEIDKGRRLLEFYTPVMESYRELGQGDAPGLMDVDVHGLINDFIQAPSAFRVKSDKGVTQMIDMTKLKLSHDENGPYRVKVDRLLLLFAIERLVENVKDLKGLSLFVSKEQGKVRITLRNQGHISEELLRIDPRTNEAVIFLAKSHLGPDRYIEEEFKRDGIDPEKLLEKLKDLGIMTEAHGVAGLNEALDKLDLRRISGGNLSADFDSIKKYKDAEWAYDVLNGRKNTALLGLRWAKRWWLQAKFPELNPQITVRETDTKGGSSSFLVYYAIRKAMKGELSIANEGPDVATTIVLPAVDLAATPPTDARAEVNPGGIDLNEKNMALDVQKGGALPGAGVASAAALDVDGLVPVIVRIAPLDDLAGYLRFPLSKTAN